MASIGGVSCTFVRGNSRGKAERVERWHVPGIDGVGAQLLGSNDSEAVFRAVNIDTGANITTWQTNLEALQGTLVAVVDDFGVTHSNVLIERVGMVRRSPWGTTQVRGMVEVRGVLN